MCFDFCHVRSICYVDDEEHFVCVCVCMCEFRASSKALDAFGIFVIRTHILEKPH